MGRIHTIYDGFVLEIKQPNKTCIVCKRYAKHPISPENGQETAARIMDIIVDDLNVKKSQIRNNSNNDIKKDGSKLVVRLFKNETNVLGEESIDLDVFPPRVKYQINILHLIPEIMKELVFDKTE